MTKTANQKRAQKRRERKKETKKAANARMVHDGPGTSHSITTLSKAPADTTDWDAVIQEALDGIKITHEEVDQREYILGLVEQTLKPHYPRVICRLFGSSETRVGFKDANADIHVSLGYDPYNNTTKKEGEEKATKLARQLIDCFKGHSELIPAGTHMGGRVPFVKLDHVPSKTRVDLSFGNVFAVAKSSLVRLLCDSHPQVRPFLLFLRLWAIAQEVAGRGRPKCRLTNYVLTQLALFTCMAREQKLVPSLDDLRKQPFDSNMIDEWECGHGTDVAAYWQKQEKKGLPTSVEGGVLALALDFFEMYAELDYKRWVVCPLLGRLVDRDILRRATAAARIAEASVGGAAETEMDGGTAGNEAATDDDDNMHTSVGVGISGSVLDVAPPRQEELGLSNKSDEKAMITDDRADDAMMTENRATDSRIITDKGAKDTMANDKGADDTMATDDGANDTMVTCDGADDTMVTDKGADDTKKTENGATDFRITDKGGDDSGITAEKGSDGSMITNAVRTDAAVTTAATVAPIATRTVAEKATVTADTILDGATRITDIVANRTAVASGSLNGTHHATDNNTATASNNVPSTATDLADDSYIDSLPEALHPHIARIIKKYRNPPLYVMDLFELDTNFTYRYQVQNVKAFKKKCRKSADIIKEVLNRERSLTALFTKIEVDE